MTNDEIFLSPYKPMPMQKTEDGETVGLKFVRVQFSARLPIIEKGEVVREEPLIVRGILPLQLMPDRELDDSTKELLRSFLTPYTRINFVDFGLIPPDWWDKLMCFIATLDSKRCMDVTDWLRSMDLEVEGRDNKYPIDRGFLRLDIGTENYRPLPFDENEST